MLVLALGSNGSGQLGIAHREDVSAPTPVVLPPTLPSSTRILANAAGGNHTLLLTEAGEVLWSGDTAALGADADAAGDKSGPASAVNVKFCRLEGIDQVAMIAATWEASILIARDRPGGRVVKVYTLGRGPRGELGRGDESTPALLRDFPPPETEIVHVAASVSHVVVVLATGDVYGWGVARKGQLGAPSMPSVATPRRIDQVPFPVVRAACGREFTVLLAADGRLLVLGPPRWRPAAADETAAVVTWTREWSSSAAEYLLQRPWSDLGAGWSAAYVLFADGTVHAWGRGDRLPPPKLPPIARLAPGSEHVIALAEGGDVLAWGWGEHGNCGGVVDHAGAQLFAVTSQRDMSSEANIYRVGAGCATSWVFVAGV